jgi:RNA polymerase sigma factor (sigma-70 family)
VEDLLQESYCKLVDREFRILRRCRQQDEKAIGAYLSRVAERVALDRLRARGAAKRGVDRSVSLESMMRRAADRLPSTGQSSAEELLLLCEEYQAFWESCRRATSRRFPERDFKILQLAFFEGMSSREISRSLGAKMTPNGVDSVLHRARKRLAAEGFLVGRRNSPLPVARMT